VDITLVDDMPTVLEVLEAITQNFVIGKAWMASEFREHNPPELMQAFARVLPSIEFEPHVEFKLRVPTTIGLIRTAGTAQYSNVILESA
jgi:D-ribose pyranase